MCFSTVFSKCISQLYFKGDTRVRLALEQCSLYFVLTPPSQDSPRWTMESEVNMLMATKILMTKMMPMKMMPTKMSSTVVMMVAKIMPNK